MQRIDIQTPITKSAPFTGGQVNVSTVVAPWLLRLEITYASPDAKGRFIFRDENGTGGPGESWTGAVGSLDFASPNTLGFSWASNVWPEWHIGASSNKLSCDLVELEGTLTYRSWIEFPG